MKHFLPKQILLEMMTGLMIGLMTVLSTVFDATLIFPGPLNIYLLNIMGVLLVSGIVLLVAVPFLSSHRFVLGSVQETTLAILLVTIPVIASSIAALNLGINPLPTIFIGIILSGICVGIVLFLLGYLKVGDFISFLPFPVMAGFLAGTGWLLLLGAWPVMIGKNLQWNELASLLTWPHAMQWVPGILFGLILFKLPKSKPLWIYMICFITAAFFYLLLAGCGISLQTAGQMGILLGPLKTSSLLNGMASFEFSQVRWDILYQQIGNLLVLMVLTPIAMLLTVSSLELETDKEFNLNQELKASGIANIISGFLGGGIIGYPSVSKTILNYKCGQQSFLTIIVAALLCLIVLICGSSLIGLLPRFIFAGLLIYIGLDILEHWLYKVFFSFSLWDYLVVWLIFLVIIIQDFLQGMAVGVLAAFIIFVIKYSRARVIKFAMTGKLRCSNVERDSQIKKILSEYSDEIFVYELQGYLFFGNGNFILKHIAALITAEEPGKIKYLLLDFKDVQGIDSSCIRSFIKIYNKINEQHGTLVMTNITRKIQDSFRKQSVLFEPTEHCRYFEDLDHGLEWCENNLLECLTNIKKSADTLKNQLKNYAKNDGLVDELFDWLNMIEVQAGDYLFRRGEPSDAMYFLEEGMVEVMIKDIDGKSIRLRTMGPGTFVGETGLYLEMPRGADVIAKENCRLFRLGLEDFRKIERDHRQIAAILHGYVACHLMERLNYANELIRTLLYSQND